MGTSFAPTATAQHITDPDLVNDLTALEEDVAREVGDDDPGIALRLASLREAFVAGTVTQGWAGVDVVRALNPESVATVIRGRTLRNKRLGEMERIRNMLALFPVLLTWVGLFFASISYRMFSEARPELAATMPFLLLWEQGFVVEGQSYGLPLASLFALSIVAALDVVIIAIMLILTWRVHLETNVNQANREQMAQTLQRRIEHVGWRAALLLARRTSPQVGVDVFRDRSDQLLDEMRAWNEEIRNLAEARIEQTQDFLQATRNFHEAATELSGMARDAKGSFENMIDIVTGVRDRIGELEDQRQSIERALSGVGPALQTYASALDKTLDTHAAAIQSSLDGNAAAAKAGLDSHAQAIQTGLDRHAASTKTTLDGHAQATQASLEGLSGQIEASLNSHGETMQQGVADLAAAAREFGERAGQAVAATQTIGEHMERIEAVLGRIQAANAQHLREGAQQVASAVQGVTASVRDLQQVLDTYQESTERMVSEGTAHVGAATQSVADAVTRIGGAVSALERRVGEERQAYDLAARSAQGAARELEEATRATGQLSGDVQRTAQQVLNLAEPLAAIEERLEVLTDALTSSSGTMARAVGNFADGAEQAGDRLNSTADGLATNAERLSALLTALEKQARERAGISIDGRRSVWDPRSWRRHR